jgi:pimeloyl-ACP methyl ester carboxylesterase
MALVNPVIVVPGITASNLRDEYSVSPDTVWSAVLHKSYERLTLHPDDVRWELREPARVAADSVFDLPYGDLIQELRHDLAEREDSPVPVYPFPYDWRQPLERVELELGAFIDEVIARTRLLKHYAKSAWSEAPRVDLVGHSMGGLVIAGHLERTGRRASVGKVVTLGTPFRGSLEAPIKVLTGTASLGVHEPNSREREAARLTPALYYLAPSFGGAVVVDGTEEEVDIFSPDAWQRGVLETLAEFIRLHGVDPPRAKSAREDEARVLLARLLDGARAHRRRVDGLRLERAGLASSDWLAIVGVDQETRVRLRLARDGERVRYILSSDDRLNRWSEGLPETGDGTVPLAGAEPFFLDRAELVCLSPDDLGYWEIGDRVLVRPAGWHALLPKCNVAQRLITKHLKGAKGDDSVWGRPAPGVAERSWRPPIPGLRPKR